MIIYFIIVSSTCLSATRAAFWRLFCVKKTADENSGGIASGAFVAQKDSLSPYKLSDKSPVAPDICSNALCKSTVRHSMEKRRELFEGVDFAKQIAGLNLLPIGQKHFEYYRENYNC